MHKHACPFNYLRVQTQVSILLPTLWYTDLPFESQFLLSQAWFCNTRRLLSCCHAAHHFDINAGHDWTFHYVWHAHDMQVVAARLWRAQLPSHAYLPYSCSAHAPAPAAGLTASQLTQVTCTGNKAINGYCGRLLSTTLETSPDW